MGFVENVEDRNSEGIDFYLLKCTFSKQCATHNIVDTWGNIVFVRFAFYIEGIFYERVDKYDIFTSF